jgi:hypothetical protein
MNDIELRIRSREDIHTCVDILKQFACQERKIACIKAIRCKWNLGLKDSKEWVEALIDAEDEEDLARCANKLRELIPAAEHRAEMYRAIENANDRDYPFSHTMAEGTTADLESVLLGYDPIFLDELIQKVQQARTTGHTTFKIILEGE